MGGSASSSSAPPRHLISPRSRRSWAEDRVHDAKPASPTEGQRWAYQRIQNGDALCKANQTLHTAAADLIAEIHRNRFYRPKVANPLSPATFVHKIRVPVFLACQFEDEQTGGHCANLADRFTGTQRKRRPLISPGPTSRSGPSPRPSPSATPG
jgi:hypothetical protein